MVDIETLSTRTNAVILTIGAIKFSRYDNAIPKLKDIKEENKLYVRVYKESCVELGLHEDPETLAWWKSQKQEVKYEALHNPDRITIREALLRLNKFLENCDCVWANSPCFDTTILESAYRASKIEIPWNYWNLRDTRTVYDIAKISLKSVSSSTDEHNAIQDCHNQINALLKCFTKLNLYVLPSVAT